MTEHTSHLNSSLSDAAFKSSCENILSKLIRQDQATIDSILNYDNPEKGEIILPDGQKFFWYFAIGSMMNPISLYLRDITPIISYPAKCPNHQLIFRGVSGMADIKVCPETEIEVHGVVHLLSDEQMTRLDAMEITYNRILVNSINYQGQSHLVYIYKMNMENLPTNLPSERYLDVIVKGCEYFNVQPEYITRLKNEQAVIPRKQPHTFQLFTDVPSDVFYSVEELAQHNGSDPTLPAWICINGKILEYVDLPYDENHPDSEVQKHILTFLKSRFGGCEVIKTMGRALYEPLYLLSLNDDNVCEQHKAQMEDEFYCRINTDQNKGRWKPIGRLRATNNSS